MGEIRGNNRLADLLTEDDEIAKEIEAYQEEPSRQRKSEKITKFEKKDKHLIPSPFFSHGSQLWMTKQLADSVREERVCRHIPLIRKTFIERIPGDEQSNIFYEVEWKSGEERTSKKVINALSISKAAETVKELHEVGANDNNAKRLIDYFDRYLSANNIPTHKAQSSLGKIGNDFIHPLFLKDTHLIIPDEGERQIKNAFQCAGTAEDWIKNVWNQLKDEPKAAFVTLASFASVIVDDLNLDPFIVDLAGKTSKGKTTTLQAAASVWGKAKQDGLMHEWNTTEVNIERKAAFLNSFPLLMDDSRKAKERILKNIVYQFSGGKSRGRGSVTGSQKQYSWKNILISTGEVPLTDYAEAEGGAAARVISLNGHALKHNTEKVAAIKANANRYYGSIGVEFLKYWFKDGQELKSEYETILKKYLKLQDDAENTVLSRITESFAAVEFAGLLLQQIGAEVDFNEIENLFREMKEENGSLDKEMQFLEQVLNVVDQQKRDIIRKGEGNPEHPKAVYKDGKFYLIPQFLNVQLDKEAKQARKEWRLRGITVSKKDYRGNYSDLQMISINGEKRRAIEVNPDYIKELGFSFVKGETF